MMIAYMYCLYSSVSLSSLSSILVDIEILTLHGLIPSGGWDVLVGDRRSACQLVLSSVIAVVEEGMNGHLLQVVNP